MIVPFFYIIEADALSQSNPIAVTTDLTFGTFYAVNTLNGCMSTPIVFVVDYTLSNVDFAFATLKYYPNPVLDVLHLVATEDMTSIEVYSIIGQRVYQSIVHAKQLEIPMHNLAAGSYIVKIIGSNGSKSLKVLKK